MSKCIMGRSCSGGINKCILHFNYQYGHIVLMEFDMHDFGV